MTPLVKKTEKINLKDNLSVKHKSPRKTFSGLDPLYIKKYKSKKKKNE